MDVITPILDRLVVKRSDPVVQSDAGILIAYADKARSRDGVIVAAGEKVSVPVGARVLFGTDVGVDVMVDGQELTVMKEEDLIAVYE